MVLEREVTETRSRLAQVSQRLNFEQQRCDQIATRITEIGCEKTNLVKAVALIDRTIAVISANGIEKIESIVTQGMRLVMGDPTVGFKIIKKEASKGNSYALEGVRGQVQGPFLQTFGGTTWNIVNFLLRVIMIKRFKLAKIVVADELFNNVSRRFQVMVSRLLRDLTKNHGYTVLAITHQPVLATAADRVYGLVPTEGQPPKLVPVEPEDAEAFMEQFGRKDEE